MRFVLAVVDAEVLGKEGGGLAMRGDALGPGRRLTRLPGERGDDALAIVRRHAVAELIETALDAFP